MPISKVLVPTDFSEHAEFAAEVAAAICKTQNAEMYALHAMQIPVYESNAQFADYQNIPEGLFFLKMAKKRFGEFLEKPFLKGVRVIEAVQMENTYESITGSAKKYGIDLIVMGSKGASGAKQLFIGSNTEKVIRHSEVPVLTIKGQMTDFAPKEIVLVSDYEEESSHIFFKAKQILDTYDANFHLLHVITPRNFESTNETLNRMTKIQEVVGLPNAKLHIQNAGSVEEGVLDFHQRQPIDLAVLGTHGRKGISHMIFGSVTEDIANASNFPILSIRL